VRRIVIVGSGGSGKSRLAITLGEQLDIPVVHLDRLYWRPGWEPTPDDEWRAVQAELVRQPAWILDGNHEATLDVRLPAADAVVFLDVPRGRCLARAVRRSFAYRWRSRPDRAEGCRERLDRDFVRWIWTFPARGRPALLAAIRDHAAHAEVVRLRTRRDVRRFLNSAALGTPS
jgi:adenylate kinase family enzyme